MANITVAVFYARMRLATKTLPFGFSSVSHVFWFVWGCIDSGFAPGTFVFHLLASIDSYSGKDCRRLCLTKSFVSTRPQYLCIAKMKNQEGHN